MPTIADDAKSFDHSDLKESLERDFLGLIIAIALS